MDGLGAINWWGFTPALDIQLYLDEKSGTATSKDEINVLLVGSGDCRHIFKTLAHCYRHPSRKINFYVTESCLELYARDMLFLNLILEPPQKFGLQEKTELFLELYGNSLVRRQTMEYVEQVSSEFIKMVTNFDYLEQKLPIIDLSNLKFKERDMLEGIFKFWRDTHSHSALFDIAKCWDLRLRQYLGVRYDAIPNVFDWDYHMRLVEKGAGIVNSRNYNRWRHRGIAYEIREGTYDTANKTLASGIVFKHEGERLARRGYWGDIIVSPYITFGIESEEQSFFKKYNNVYMKTSEDVAEYNVLSLMHEITHRTYYEPPKESKTDASLSEIAEESVDEIELSAAVTELQVSAEPTTECSPVSVDGVKVFILPLNYTSELVKKSKFQQLFDIVYISNSHSHLLTPDLTSTFAPETVLVMDTAKFMLELKPEQTCQYVEKIISLAESAGCKVSEPVDEKNDVFVKFTLLPCSST